ncbi:MAG: endonuclease/exonuclease/phosphatase family protein [Phycisphaeraceae bacterium]|nr:endonuclease/exonuclease/phosphatase family protein [Phycisphaeraceae bacterium]MCB9847082.1 endonuclease/exonuclease/phosphatase family protein [Phycisphaeraceae bacterium]
MRIVCANVFCLNPTPKKAVEALARQGGDVTVVIESTPRFAERSERLLGERRMTGLSRRRGMPISVYSRADLHVEEGASPGQGWIECRVGAMRLLLVHAIAPYLPWRIPKRRGHLTALSERMSELADNEPALTIGDFNTAHFERAWRRFASSAVDSRWHWLTHEEDHRPEKRRGTWPFGSVWSPVALDHALVCPRIGGAEAAPRMRSFTVPGSDHRGLVVDVEDAAVCGACMTELAGAPGEPGEAGLSGSDSEA